MTAGRAAQRVQAHRLADLADEAVPKRRGTRTRPCMPLCCMVGEDRLEITVVQSVATMKRMRRRSAVSRGSLCRLPALLCGRPRIAPRATARWRYRHPARRRRSTRLEARPCRTAPSTKAWPSTPAAFHHRARPTGPPARLRFAQSCEPRRAVGKEYRRVQPIVFVAMMDGRPSASLLLTPRVMKVLPKFTRDVRNTEEGRRRVRGAAARRTQRGEAAPYLPPGPAKPARPVSWCTRPYCTRISSS